MSNMSPPDVQPVRGIDSEKGRLHACSTVDTNDLAVNPLAVLRREEADDAGNVDGLADTLHWGPCLGVLHIDH